MEPKDPKEDTQPKDPDVADPAPPSEGSEGPQSTQGALFDDLQPVQPTSEEKPKQKRADIWKTKGLTDRVQELLREGALTKENPERFIADTLNEEFKEPFGERRVTPHAMRVKLDSFIWTSERLNLLKKFVARGWDFKGLYAHFAYIPKDEVGKKAKKLRGHSAPKEAIEAETGMGRLATMAELARADLRGFTFPEGTFADPYVVDVPSNKFKVMVVNAPHIGLTYNPVIDDNPLRCALRTAAGNGDDAVLITGGLMFLDVKKSAGYLTTHRALLSGITFDEKVLDPDYREKAKRIYGEKPSDETIYTTFRENFMNLIGGFQKIALGVKPFPRKIYVTFGLLEEAVIEATAHWHVLYITTVNREKLRSEREELRALLCAALRESKGKETAYITSLKEDIIAICKEESRMIQSNVIHEERKRFVAILRAWVVEAFKKAIPNCEVVAQGSVIVKMGTAEDAPKIEIHQVRNLRDSEGFLDEFLLMNAGRRGLDGSLPNVVLIASPYSVNHRWAVSEVARGGERTSSRITQLPVLLDKEFVLSQKRTIVRKVDPIERLIHHHQFEPGAVRLTYENGFYDEQLFSIPTLKRAFEKSPKARFLEKEEYVYLFVRTDDHFGHPWKEYYFDPVGNRLVDHVSGVIEILRRFYVKQGRLYPIHAHFSLDDETQGHHFPTQSQPHQQVQSFTRLQREFAAALHLAKERGTPEVAFKLLESMHAQLLDQIRFRGEHWPQTQVEHFIDEAITPNLDFFASILKRNLKGEVVFRGVSEILGYPYDSRDVAPITYGSGNHFGNTMDGELTEGFIYARDTRRGLASDPDLKSLDLERLIRAPLHGNTPVAYGHLQAGRNGYEWGISLRRDPSRKSGQNGDPLRGASANVIERGNFARIFDRRVTLHLSGDIHRFGCVRLTNATVVSCAPGTDTDPYGERGFSNNNVGNLVVGLPVHGPSAGPIRLIVFNHDFVRKYLANPWEMDWDRIFVRPA